MNEAVNIGMSIMDNYFEKLDPKQAKSADSDQDDDEVDMLVANASNVDFFIYETKDPYVLRSLPYLIGSQAFLDNDHVGLRDLDSDDEEMDGGDEESLYEETAAAAPAPADDNDVEDHYSDEDNSPIASGTKIARNQNYNDSSSTSSSSGELFVKSKPTTISEKLKVSLIFYFVHAFNKVYGYIEILMNFSKNFH